jgi:sulfide:quinone oxidoreductase
MQRVTIIGAGFGALNAVRRLRRCNGDVGIDLVAPRPSFLFYPGTIWIPSEDRDPDSFDVPLQRFFERNDVAWHPGRATALENGGRRVVTDGGAIDNDGLILAPGGEWIDDVPGREHTFLPCGGPTEMARLRDRVRALDRGTLAFGFSPHPDEPSSLRAGPVFELMFGIETWLRRNRRRDRFRIVLFTPVAQPGERLGPGAARRLRAQMDKRGIEVHTGTRPLRFEADRVATDRAAFDARVIVYMPGIGGAPWFAETGLQRSPAGLFEADAFCRAPGAERVYVVGDAGHFDGPDWLPKRGHTAESQGDAAARNLAAELAGKPPTRRFRTGLLCIIDLTDQGILIVRTERFAIATPPMRPVHWAKRVFERQYKRRFGG